MHEISCVSARIRMLMAAWWLNYRDLQTFIAKNHYSWMRKWPSAFPCADQFAIVTFSVWQFVAAIHLHLLVQSTMGTVSKSLLCKGPKTWELSKFLCFEHLACVLGEGILVILRTSIHKMAWRGIGRAVLALFLVSKDVCCVSVFQNASRKFLGGGTPHTNTSRTRLKQLDFLFAQHETRIIAINCGKKASENDTGVKAIAACMICYGNQRPWLRAAVVFE